MHTGRKGGSKDCFEERPQCPETLLEKWGLLDTLSISSFPERPHSFPSFTLKSSDPQAGRARARAIIPLGTAWSCRGFICCRQDSKWLCSTWGRSPCSGRGAEWRFTAHSMILRQFFHPKRCCDSLLWFCIYSRAWLCQKGGPALQRWNSSPPPSPPPHPCTDVCSNTSRAGSSTTQAPNCSYTHPPSSAQCSSSSSSPARENNQKGAEWTPNTSAHSQTTQHSKPGQVWAAPLCRGIAASGRAARAQGSNASLPGRSDLCT